MVHEPADFDDVADELYGLDPATFVARRNDLAKSIRSDDRELATRITHLRRPTTAAWSLNQWARRSPDEVDEIVALGEDLRDTQRRSAATQIRSLSRRRQEVIAAALKSVGDVCASLDTEMSAAVGRDVAQTLRAAIADPEVAATLRRGRLVGAVEYSGFGPAGLAVVTDASAGEGVADAPTSADPAADPSGPAEPDEHEAAAARAVASAESAATRRTFNRAVQAAERAARQSSAATERADELGRRASALREELARIRAELARVEDELRFADRAVTTAAAAHRDATDALVSAREAADAAQRRLDEVTEAPDSRTGRSRGL
ncbi:hypothetical protein [Gordonia sp. NPDC003429]